jgi:hypothetical protein
MLNLFRDGGFSMWFVLAFGGVSLVTAFSFAMRPSAAVERFVAWMALATMAAVGCGVSSDLAATFYFVAGQPIGLEKRIQLAMQGVAESMAPAIAGFAFVALVAVMLAVGKRRRDAMQ